MDDLVWIQHVDDPHLILVFENRMKMQKITAVFGSRNWLANLTSAILVALVHVGFGLLLSSSVGEKPSGIRVGQILPSSVLILIDSPERKPKKIQVITDDGMPDPASKVVMSAETPQLPMQSRDSVGRSPMGGLRMRWVSTELPSEEVLKWREAVRRAIERTWMRPNGTGVDSSCRVTLIQNISGGVIGARVLQCDADDSIRASLLAAIFHASPLPPFPNGQPLKDAEIEFQIVNSV